jgi:hypothetical protein
MERYKHLCTLLDILIERYEHFFDVTIFCDGASGVLRSAASLQRCRRSAAIFDAVRSKS